jgi:hypothetical protein
MFYTDIAGLCAPLSFDGSSTQLVQLVAGGNAILTPPNLNVDGRVIKIRMSGNIQFSDLTNIPAIGLSFGTSLPLSFPLFVTANGGVAGTVPFMLEAELVWTSESSDICGIYRYATFSSTFLAANSVVAEFVSNQSSIQYVVFAESLTGTPFSTNCVLTLKELSISAN